MAERYIAFDVETPNSRNDSISAIGVTVVENGGIAQVRYTLVDPEDRFDPFNIALTGITPEMVAGKPNFALLWTELGPLLESGLILAHNAQFDMAVLAKCLRRYGILWRRQVDYLCICQMGRRALPNLANHKLNTLCDYLGLELDHHNAGSDSRACAELLRFYLQQGLEPTEFLRRYDLVQAKTVPMPRRGR